MFAYILCVCMYDRKKQRKEEDSKRRRREKRERATKRTADLYKSEHRFPSNYLYLLDKQKTDYPFDGHVVASPRLGPVSRRLTLSAQHNLSTILSHSSPCTCDRIQQQPETLKNSSQNLNFR